MKDNTWKCDICKTRYDDGYICVTRSTFPSAGPNMFEEHPERFCFKCYANGVMWAMKQASRR